MKQWKCGPRTQDSKAGSITVLLRHSEPVNLCSSPFIFLGILQWDCADAPSPTSLVKTWKMVTGSVKMLVPTREESTSNLEGPEGAAGHCLTDMDVQGWGMPWVHCQNPRSGMSWRSQMWIPELLLLMSEAAQPWRSAWCLVQRKRGGKWRREKGKNRKKGRQQICMVFLEASKPPECIYLIPLWEDFLWPINWNPIKGYQSHKPFRDPDGLKCSIQTPFPLSGKCYKLSLLLIRKGFL